MAATPLPGAEIVRHLNSVGSLVSIRDDGTVWAITAFNRKWRLAARKKEGVPLEEWKDRKLAAHVALPAWARKTKSLPSIKTLEEWAGDSVCESVTGETVEHDGHSADGAPSWLLALGLI